MIFSEKWLREWVNPALSTEELVAQITMAGLEVDGVEAAAAAFSGVVVGEIVSVEQHPDADKLRVCQVAGNGEEPTQVVCGAPNARVGIKIPFATVGARLPGDFKIKKAKLRGVESFGMLCAEEELGFSDASDGLWELPADAPVGADIRDYLALDDQLIEVDLTPNRGDCLSVLGLARDVSVLNEIPMTPPVIDFTEPTHDDVIEVAIAAVDACPRYASRVVKNVDVSASTPMWMVERLRRSGIRSIDPVVDVTNYVLVELGQPMHAFDLNKVNGGIIVRMADADEKLTLLDGQEVALREDTLVIANREGAMAMAGIMGGLDSGVTSATQDIVFESAHFDPIAVAGKARSYGLHTDSSHRFERGVDLALQELAIERATQLLIDICGGEPGPIQVVEGGIEDIKKRQVVLRKTRVADYLELELEADVILAMMLRLGLELEEETDTAWTFSVPTWRFDISIEADLIEEVGRIYGYDKLPTNAPKSQLSITPMNESRGSIERVRQSLIARDYQEAITYSFVDPASQTVFDPTIKPVELANPISADLSVMRTSLWAGLMNAVKRNLARQQSRIRMFETGLTFIPAEDGEVIQTSKLAMLLTGDREDQTWHKGNESVDFFDIKGDLEAILPAADWSFTAQARDGLHPGQTAQILRSGTPVGWVGAIHPQALRALGVSQSVFVVEIELESVLQGQVPVFTPISKFPETRRDIAVVVHESIAAEQLVNSIRSELASAEIFQNVSVFDVYQGEGIEIKRKSVALGLTFRHPSRTLNDEEVNDCMESVITKLQNEYEATLRS